MANLMLMTSSLLFFPSPPKYVPPTNMLPRRNGPFVPLRSDAVPFAIPYLSAVSPRIMTKSLVIVAIQWMNAFSSTGGASTQYSPSDLVFGKRNPDCKRKRLPFGAYAYAYTGTSNTIEPRATPCIALAEGNDQDSLYFMPLETGQRLHSCR